MTALGRDFESRRLNEALARLALADVIADQGCAELVEALILSGIATLVPSTGKLVITGNPPWLHGDEPA